VRVVAGVLIGEIAQRSRTGFVEPSLHTRQVAQTCGMRQIVWKRPDAGEQWDDVRPCVGHRVFDGRRIGRLAPQHGGIDIEKSDDEVRAIAERRDREEPGLKLQTVFAE
jgi:hypothetical protein